MEAKKLPENIRPSLDSPVSIKKMGHITEVRYMQRKTGIFGKLIRTAMLIPEQGK